MFDELELVSLGAISSLILVHAAAADDGVWTPNRIVLHRTAGDERAVLL